MLLSIHAARTGLAQLPMVLGGNNMLALAIFLFVLFPGAAHVREIFIAVASFSAIGFFVGAYLKYRSSFDSTCGLWGYLYLIVVLELMLSGGGFALVFSSAGRLNIVWFAVCANALILLLTVLAGMWREAISLDFFSGPSGRWKKNISRYIDCSRHQVDPLLITDFPLMGRGRVVRSPVWIAAVGSTNIPFLFEVFAGGRVSAVFWVVPLLAGLFSYLNISSLGPGLLRIILLRRLEKCLGRRFINADLVHIQELRRGFLMARWLMKDFSGLQGGQR
ncbi:hypothetical protein [Curvibacter gracilis]|uniref:hypothetical protein n=1 Tax=Curvibacter gracilis TaxID=230310 RepID=UPI00048A109E|nr:hypothetical protein [Curvibacter gracilis]